MAVILLSVVTQRVTAQEIFVTEGETVTYRVWLDESIQNGTVSDALQNLPGVRVDMDGNITMRGVNNVEIFINDQASYLSDDARKNYLQQTPASDIKEIMAIVNPSAQYTTTSNTGIINIITKDINASKRSLNAGFQINTKLDYSPWLSYSYSKNKFTFLANAKCTYNNNYTDGNSTGISYQDESHADTLNLIRS
ncbi:MAG: TonB-dependent receptor plug domain-containing protein, partial [Bacteroidales bacterium]|nr:TonB-dependent receptor plug domain-containing protein [Bacteroidales bacterium]